MKRKLYKEKKMLLAVICLLTLVMAGCKNQAGFYVTQEENSDSEKQVTDGGSTEADDAEGNAPGEKESTSDSGSVKVGDTAAGGDEDTPEAGGAEAAGKAAENPGSLPEIYVQVSGAVVNPGVYKLPSGSRIFEAVVLAGGTTGEADLASVNQAQVLSDGQMIYIYAIGEERRSSSDGAGTGAVAGEASDGKVNLNTASAEELMTLPGVGASKAEDIISWREENGGFDRVEDIMNIQGIKEGVFSKIEDRIKVN